MSVVQVSTSAAYVVCSLEPGMLTDESLWWVYTEDGRRMGVVRGLPDYARWLTLEHGRTRYTVYFDPETVVVRTW